MTLLIKEPYREVAAAILVGTCGRLALQQRDDIPGLLYAGQIGLFGGHREGRETPIETVVREVLEETGLAFAPERFEPLVELAAAYPPGGIKGSYYVLHGVPIEQLVVTEGTLRIAEVDELPELLARMTPSACYVTRLYMEAVRRR